MWKLSLDSAAAAMNYDSLSFWSNTKVKVKVKITVKIEF